MPGSDEPIRRMTLGNMRSLGVRSLFATCRTSDHETTVNVDAWSPSHPMDPKGNANCYHQKQRQRHRKTNRIRIHLSTSLPALGTKSHRTHSDNVPVLSFGPRMRCGRCGNLGATRPELDRAAGQPAPDTAMSPTAEQRRALAILRSSKNG
jgi:hypothetical protein